MVIYKKRPSEDIISRFFKLESASGIILLFAATLAIIIANSDFAQFYQEFVNLKVMLQIGSSTMDGTNLFVINDILMTLFFIIVGIEVKREVFVGGRSSFEKIFAPTMAAIFGVVAPAIIYFSLNSSVDYNMRGWAIPIATDIAFAFGIISLFGSKVSSSIKTFLMTLAIIDDLIAILVISIFYSHGANIAFMGLSLLAFFVLIILNRRGVTDLWPYFTVGIFLWIFVLNAGIHPTIAGVILAFVLPTEAAEDEPGLISPSQRVEYALHPWVAFAILPIFVFANSGLSFSDMSSSVLTHPILLGACFGLLLGKPLGILLSMLLMKKFKIANLPEGSNWFEFAGMACLAGIGFTMSLFIGTLAFDDYFYQVIMRAGVFSGSILASILGCILISIGILCSIRLAKNG